MSNVDQPISPVPKEGRLGDRLGEGEQPGDPASEPINQAAEQESGDQVAAPASEPINQAAEEDTDDDQNTVVIKARILPDEFEALRKGAAQAGIPLNNYVRKAIVDEGFLQQQLSSGSQLLIRSPKGRISKVSAKED